MSVWRIAIVTGVFGALFLALFLCYQIFFLENTAAISTLSTKTGYGAILWLGAELYVFSFIVALITFPFYLVKSLPWFYLPFGLLSEGKSYYSRLNIYTIISLAASTTILLVVLGVGFYAAYNT